MFNLIKPGMQSLLCYIITEQSHNQLHKIELFAKFFIDFCLLRILQIAPNSFGEQKHSGNDDGGGGAHGGGGGVGGGGVGGVGGGGGGVVGLGGGDYTPLFC